jgi:hypothetical protein
LTSTDLPSLSSSILRCKSRWAAIVLTAAKLWIGGIPDNTQCQSADKCITEEWILPSKYVYSSTTLHVKWNISMGGDCICFQLCLATPCSFHGSFALHHSLGFSSFSTHFCFFDLEDVLDIDTASSMSMTSSLSNAQTFPLDFVLALGLAFNFV